MVEEFLYLEIFKKKKGGILYYVCCSGLIISNNSFLSGLGRKLGYVARYMLLVINYSVCERENLC